MTTAKQILYSPVDIDDAEFENLHAEATEEEIDFEKFRDEMRESNEYAKLTITRQPTTSDGRPGAKKGVFLFECGLDEYSFSQLCGKLRDDYGTGLYRIQARNEKGQLKINKSVAIEAPKDTEKNPASPVGSIIDQFSVAMERQSERQEAMFRELNPRSTGDPIDQITKLATAVGTVLGALGIMPGQNKAPTMAEQFKEMMFMKKMMDEFGGGDSGGGDANLYSLLTETMKSFGGPIAAAIAAGQTTGEVSPQGLLQNPTTEIKPELTPEQIEQKKYGEAMKTQVRILIANAKNKADPQQFASLVVANTPDEKLDDLYEFIAAPDFYDRILALNPEVEIYKDWFIKLRDAVMELLTEPENEPSIPELKTVAGDSVEIPLETETPISDEPNSDTTPNP